MSDAKTLVDQYYLEMRWRLLSLAADFDRIERADGGAAVMQSDARLAKLREGLRVVLEARGDRAERFQDLLSDHTPPPK